MVKDRISAILSNTPVTTYTVDYSYKSTVSKVVKIDAQSRAELEGKINTNFEEVVSSDEETGKLQYKILEETVEDFPEF